MSGVDPFHIKSRIGFGVPLGLGIGQHRGKVGTLLGHPGENVVTGTVEDTEYALKTVGAEIFLDGTKYRDAAADRSFEQDIHPRPLSCLKDFLTMHGQQSFVGRHDMLAVGVITSYSIHYTKLYEMNLAQWEFQKSEKYL